MADLTDEAAPDDSSAVFLTAWKRTDQVPPFLGSDSRLTTGSARSARCRRGAVAPDEDANPSAGVPERGGARVRIGRPPAPDGPVAGDRGAGPSVSKHSDTTHLWTYDHLSWRRYRDRPWHATIPWLTGLAASDELPPARHQWWPRRTSVTP